MVFELLDVVVEVVDGELDELATRPIATAATTTTTVSAIHHLLLRRMIHSPVASSVLNEHFALPSYFQRKFALRRKLGGVINRHRIVTWLTENSKFRIFSTITAL
jgi:hypothetical protein